MSEQSTDAYDKYNRHERYDRYNSDQAELERLLTGDVHLDQEPVVPPSSPVSSHSSHEDEAEENKVPAGGDLQGAIGLFAEAAQDLATASVELGLGRHFACADFCNQAVEKAAQAVSLLRSGRRSPYDHDLGVLGRTVGAPPEIQENMAILTPFHPETFYADTPPEEADEVINAEQAATYIQHARRVIRWARSLILNA